MGGDPVLERLALQAFHHNEGSPCVFTNFVNRADVGMIERRGGARLALEALQEPAVLGEFFGQELERDHAAELGVFRLVHHTHAAPAELFQHPVVGNRAANHLLLLLPFSRGLPAMAVPSPLGAKCSTV